ncbi:MAG: 50S ribosomal protein L17 [Acidobacteria bacterium]|nr:50S ribosomal protein L17 [Acidobacteriota bacterium]MCG3192497.1 50S ribosomal protein L17 [Thermoanaerobaculia bacterium]
MQHNRAGRKLGRTTAHRQSLFRNQLSSLFTHERIRTTLYKAKELRPLAEKMITLGKKGGLAARRLALSKLPDKSAVGRVFDELAPRYKERQGGYTRILKLGRRQGDAAEMAILELVDYDFAQRRAEKIQAAKQSTETKKESLLERAKRLVTGKKSEEKKEEGGTEASAEEKPKKAAKAPKAPKAKVSSTRAKGGTKVTAPRKQGQ